MENLGICIKFRPIAGQEFRPFHPYLNPIRIKVLVR